MEDLPSISDSEWKIMKLLWRDSPQPAYDIAQELGKTSSWDIRTVKTLLSRLVKKGALSYNKYKNLYLYFPVIQEEEYKRSESESFLNQVFDGSVSELFVHFAKSRNLTPEQIERLRGMTENMED